MKIRLHEPLVAITDLLLAMECAVLSWRIIAGPAPDTGIDIWFTVFFAAIGVSALAGGIVHGFSPVRRARLHTVLWRVSLGAIGIAGFAAWTIGGRLLLAPALQPALTGGAAILLGLLLVTLMRRHPPFRLAVLYYAPAALVLMAGFGATYRHTPTGGLAAGVAGLGLSLGAAALQQARIGIPRWRIDHNSLYHLIQALALLCVYAGAAAIIRSTAA